MLFLCTLSFWHFLKRELGGSRASYFSFCFSVFYSYECNLLRVYCTRGNAIYWRLITKFFQWLVIVWKWGEESHQSTGSHGAADKKNIQECSIFFILWDLVDHRCQESVMHPAMHADRQQGRSSSGLDVITKCVQVAAHYWETSVLMPKACGAGTETVSKGNHFM